MGLLSGLEKFGLGKQQEAVTGISAGSDKEEKKVEKKKEEPKETDYLIQKNFVCPVCSRKFTAISVRGTKLRRMDPDMDLRPRYENVDVLKFDTIVCQNCGYAAMGSYFEPITPNQIKRLKEQIMVNFKPVSMGEKETYTYEEAIERYNLCLLSAMVKNVRLSEKAYICLKTAWLYRDLVAEEKKKEDVPKEKIEEHKKQFDAFYKEAYDGFTKAISTEHPPLCGMNTTTVEYLLANMATYFGDITTAYRFVSSLLQSKATNPRMKDRCLDLKDQLNKMKEQNKA